MQLLIEKDPTLFLEQYSEFIHHDLVGNNLLIGLLHDAIDNNNDVHCMAVVSVKGEVHMLALQAPPNAVIFSVADNLDAVKFFADEFCKFGVPVTASIGSKPVMSKFLSIHNSVFKDGQLAKFKDDTYYSINGGINIEYEEQGELVFAKKKDIPMLAEWKDAFNKEILDKNQHASEEENEEFVRTAIERGAVANLVVDGEIVSSATFLKAGDIARFKFVYTPVEYRGKGYAKELIVKLTNYLFEVGYEACCLITYTDNKGANGLYHSAGYIPREGFAYYVPKDIV